MDLLHISGMMINMDESWNEDRNEISQKPDPVWQSYLESYVVWNGSAQT